MTQRLLIGAAVLGGSSLPSGPRCDRTRSICRRPATRSPRLHDGARKRARWSCSARGRSRRKSIRTLDRGVFQLDDRALAQT